MERPRKPMSAIAVIFLAVAMFLPGFLEAGDLEPTAPPGPTMHTLEEIYNKPIWPITDLTFKTWPSNPRFKVSYYQDENERLIWTDVVLDLETGLLWERTPDAVTTNWFSACTGCFYKNTGDRFGWRLPTIEELMTLLSITDDLLPLGHPFLNVPSGSYWSITTDPSNSNTALVVIYDGPSGGLWGLDKNLDEGPRYKWCVRGGTGHDAY